MKIVVDTGDDYPEYDNSSEDSSISSIDSSLNDIDVDEASENFDDIEDQNLINYDRYQKNDRQNFIDMFKDKHSYLKANSIADSKKIIMKKDKIYAVYEHYSVYREFPENKRKSRSPSKKLSENNIDFLEEELESNLNLKNNAMAKLLKTNLELKFQKEQLEEHCKSMNIIILDLKYAQKYLERAAKKD